MRRLGRGAFGEVFLVEDAVAGAERALKILSPGSSGAEDTVREYLALASIVHHAIVRVHDLVRLPGTRLGLTLEYIDGVSLDEWSAREPAVRLLPLLLDVADGLAALHRRGLLHNDLSAENVLVRSEGDRPRAVLVDLGLASGPDSRTGETSGRLRALAPEVLAGAPADHRADLYALGVLLADVFGSEPLWVGLSIADMSEAKRRGPPRIGLRSGAPPGILPVIEGLLSPSPDARPRSAWEVLRLLQNVAGPDDGVRAMEPSLSLPPPLVGRAEECERAHRILSGEAALLLIDGPPRAGSHRLAEEIALRDVLDGRTLVRVADPRAGTWTPADAQRCIALVDAAGFSTDTLEALRVLLWRILDGGHHVVMTLSGLADDGRSALEQICREVGSEYACARIEATALGDADGIALAKGALGGSVPAGLAEAVTREAAGLPGEIVETLRGLIECGALRPAEDGLAWSMDGDVDDRLRAGRTTPAPVAVTREEHVALALCHAIGDGLDERTVAGALARLLPTADETITSLARRGLLLRLPGSRAALRVAPAARQVSMKSLPDQDRRDMAQVAFELLAARTEPDVALTVRCVVLGVEAGMTNEARAAFHAVAGMDPRAVASGLPILETAAHATTDPELHRMMLTTLLSAAEAADAWATIASVASEMLETAPVQERVNLLSRRAQALLRMNDVKKAQEDIGRAQEIFESAGESAGPDDRARFLAAVGEADLAAGDDRAAIEALRAAIGVEGLDQALRGSLESRLGAILFRARRLTEAQDVLQRALARAQELRLTETIARVVHNLALVHLWLGHSEAVPPLLDAVAPLLVGSGPGDQAYLLQLHALAAQHAGEDSAAEGIYADACRLARVSGNARLLTSLRVARAGVVSDLGDVTRARGLLEEAEPLARSLGDRAWGLVLVNHAYNAILAGEPGLARRLLTQVHSLAVPSWIRALAHVHQARLALGSDERGLREALRSLEDARGLVDGSRTAAVTLAHAALLEAEVHLLRGALGEARAAIAEAARQAEEARDAGSTIRALTLRAELALHERSFEEANGALSAALALATAKQRPIARAQALIVLARVRLEGPLPDERAAIDALREAAHLAEKCGARSVAAIARDGMEHHALRQEEDRGGEQGMAESLAVAGYLLASGADCSAIASRLLDVLLTRLPLERALVLLRDGHGGGWTVIASRHADPEMESKALQVSESILREAESSGDMLVIEDASESPSFALQDSVRRFQIRTVAAVPLRADGETVGLLYLDNRTIAGALTERHRTMLRVVAGLAATSLRQARLSASLATARAALAEENRMLEERLTEVSHTPALLGESATLRRLREDIRRVAQVSTRVLITGETGVGKELVARNIHALSLRRSAPFRAVNCGALPAGLVEAELFGVAKGAATQTNARAGFFEQADGGTLFLDEVAELPPAVQPAFLRVLDDGAVTRVGAERSVTVAVRVIAATNKNLADLIRRGAFREDLYQRLAAVVLSVPPLRERTEDIPLLAQYLLARLCADHGRALVPLSREALRRLAARDWPGNVRELTHVLDRALLFGDGKTLNLDIIAGGAGGDANRLTAPEPPQVPVAGVSRAQLLDGLARANGNYCETGRLLGLSEATVRRWVRKYGIVVPGRRPGRPRALQTSAP